MNGDPYEDYPDDQDKLSDGSVQDKPEVALRVAQEIREIGNKLFKEGKAEAALGKYQSGSRCFVSSIPPLLAHVASFWIILRIPAIP